MQSIAWSRTGVTASKNPLAIQLSVSFTGLKQGVLARIAVFLSKIMAIPFFGNKYHNHLAGFAGFEEIRPVYGPDGTERFGVIKLSPEFSPNNPARKTSFARALFGRDNKKEASYTGVLRLSGPALNLWLAPGKAAQPFYESLCKALPVDCPVQFLLRRRKQSLEQHYQAFQQNVLRRIKDEDIANFFLQEYLDNQVYPAEESGLSEKWFGLLVSANSIETLTGQMAALVATLPCDAAPCQAVEIAEVVLDYYAPLVLEAQRESGQDRPDRLHPAMLAEAGLHIEPETTRNGFTTAYWKLSAPPLSHPAGWTATLLDNERLNKTEFDISIHLTPANRDDKLLEVLDRRLAFLDEQLAAAFTQGDCDVLDDLQEQHMEVSNRLSAALDPENRYFEAGITLAMRAGEGGFAAACLSFEEELKSSGLSARRTHTAAETRSAMLECAPLNLAQSERPLVLPASEAGRLAHLAPVTVPLENIRQPLAGLTHLGEPLYLNPAARPGEAAFFLPGENGTQSAQQARTTLRYLTVMQWLGGSPVCGLDRKGEWEDLTLQFGGQYISLGPNEPVFNFNPLEVTDENLKLDDHLVNWLNETAAFLGELLKLDLELQEDLLAVLFEAAIARVNRGDELNAASLWIRAECSGYGPLAAQLKELAHNGRFGWLCARPTRLPQPGAGNGLVFIGLSYSLQSVLGEDQQKFYFARLFSRLTAQLCATPSSRPYLLVIDRAQELLADPVSARSLARLEQRSREIKARMWLISPGPAEWLNSFQGRNLFDRAACHIFFNQSQNQMSPVARRFKLSHNLVKTVRETGPGGAVVRQLDEDGQPCYFAFEPLPGSYFDRFAVASGRLANPANLKYPRPEPVEVPLFAPEEIWDEMELWQKYPVEETIEVVGISQDETALAVIA
jgi:hypothetical protein